MDVELRSASSLQSTRLRGRLISPQLEGESGWGLTVWQPQEHLPVAVASTLLGQRDAWPLSCVCSTGTPARASHPRGDFFQVCATVILDPRLLHRIQKLLNPETQIWSAA